MYHIKLRGEINLSESYDLVELAVDKAQSLGASYAEARFQEDTEMMFFLKNKELQGVLNDLHSGIGIRVLVNGSFGFAATNVLTEESIIKIVEHAVKLAKAYSKLSKEPIELSEEPTVKTKWSVEEKKPKKDIDITEKIKYVIDVEDAVTEVNVPIPIQVYQYREMDTRKYFVNSDGTVIESFVPRVELFAMITGFKPNVGVEQIYDNLGGSGGWEIVESWKLEKRVKHNAEVIKGILETQQKPPTDIIDVVLGTLVVGLGVHESPGHPSEADRILGREAAQAGESFMKKEMLGIQIGSECVTVIDDPTIKNSFGYYEYDDEGVKARPRYLIKNGILNEFLHNRETAAKFGIKSNAAARASYYNREPIIRMANTYMQPGDYTFEELIEDIKLGVFMKTFGEWNIDDRRYNMRFVGKEAYLIENGELKGFVKHPILEITIPAYYKSIDAVSKNLHFDAATCGKGDPDQGVPVWHGGPEARLRNIKLGGVSA